MVGNAIWNWSRSKMIKNYNKIKYVSLIILYFLILLCSYSNYNNLFIIMLIITGIFYYIIRVIWFKGELNHLRKYIFLLILEDVCISIGLIAMFFTIKPNINKNFINVLYCLCFIPFLTPSIIFHYKYVKKNER